MFLKFICRRAGTLNKRGHFNWKTRRLQIIRNSKFYSDGRRAESGVRCLNTQQPVGPAVFATLLASALVSGFIRDWVIRDLYLAKRRGIFPCGIFALKYLTTALKCVAYLWRTTNGRCFPCKVLFSKRTFWSFLFASPPGMSDFHLRLFEAWAVGASHTETAPRVSASTPKLCEVV